MSKKEYDKAIADYTEAIRLDPEDATALPQPRRSPGCEEGVRQGHRRLHRGHPPRPQERRCVHRDRGYVLDRQGRLRQGDRRLHRGHPARSEGRHGVLQPGRRLVPEGGIRQGDRRLHRGHPARSQGRRGLLRPRLRLDREERIRQGHRRLHRGHPARSQATPRPTTTGHTPGRTRRSTTRRSPTTPRPSGSIPNVAAAYYSRGIAWQNERGLRQGHRRLHRGHPPRSQDCLAYYNRGDRLDCEKEELRQGDRRLHRGHPARSQGTPCRTTTAATPGEKKGEYDKAIADFTEAIRLDPKDARAYYNRGVAWTGEGGIRQGDRRLHRGHPARSQGCLRLRQPRAAPGAERRNMTRRSPTSTRPSGSIPKDAINTVRDYAWRNQFRGYAG